jgi:hypothetical protein
MYFSCIFSKRNITNKATVNPNTFEKNHIVTLSKNDIRAKSKVIAIEYLIINFFALFLSPIALRFL